eukprot:CAMPEP_0169121452 /NCGR_PEP_ID=MMETSP1015-20121227/32678_1 /TAXON_ID=342587 /ORGANISM="Karlodinium micrum, Strain CCMP2283" /LENGTH=250 /DNA_ID=CAMNT_0009184561 /DNA_START=86 /DNA_END=838 /DNA_ORIENTATION=-
MMQSSKALKPSAAKLQKSQSLPMNPDQRSMNLLPVGHRGMDPEVVRRAFFSTTTRGALPNHFSESKLRASRAVVDRVHYRDLTKPPAWQPSSIPPMTKKDFCEYHKEFIPRSLANAKVDREMAAMFSENFRSGGSASTGQPCSSETTFRATYPAPTKDGRGESFKPDQPIHIDFNSRLLETTSSLKKSYPAHDRRIASRFRGERVEPFSNSGVNYGQPFEGKPESRREFSAATLKFKPSKFPKPATSMQR